MPISVKHVIEALVQIGGRGSVEEIHRAVILLAPPPLPKDSRQVVQGRLQDHSRQSAQYSNRGDYFRNVHGLAVRRGIWELTPDGVMFAGKGVPNPDSAASNKELEKGTRNPTWSRDELTLALDLYVKTGGNPTAKDDAALDALPERNLP